MGMYGRVKLGREHISGRADVHDTGDCYFVPPER
jgi:hypothetical protein